MIKPALHSEQLDTAFRKIGAQRSVGKRAEELAKHDTPLMRRVMNASYNPYITYGIKLSTKEENTLIGHSMEEGGYDIDDPEVWNVLDQLAKSSATSASKFVLLQTFFQKVNYQTAGLILAILRKNAITNVSVSTVNKAFPGLIPVFAVQLAAKFSSRKASFPCYVEPKFDGVRATAIVYKTGVVEVKTRTGRDIPAASFFHKELQHLAAPYFAALPHESAVVFDGELLGTDFNNTVSVFRSDKPATSGTYQIFDMLPIAALAADAWTSKEYEARRNQLEALFSEYRAVSKKLALAQSYKVSNIKEIWDLYANFSAAGLEGCIVKLPDGKWCRKRTNDWMKIKAEESADLPIIGAFEGTGKYEGMLGGLIVDFKGVDVEVGSGFDDKARRELWDMYLNDLLKAEVGDKDYELLGSIAELTYQEVTPAGSLRHPIFKRRRDDKREVSF